MLYRNAPVGDAKVALGSISEVLAGKAPLLRIEKLSKLELEDKNEVYYAKLWYKSDSVSNCCTILLTDVIANSFNS